MMVLKYLTAVTLFLVVTNALLNNNNRIAKPQLYLKLFNNNNSNNNEATNSIIGESPLQDYTNDAINLFGSFRIPAMLLAGASYGGAFALPLAREERLLLQLAKRSYIIVSILSIASSLLVTVLSTVVIEKLSITEGTERTPAKSFKEYLETNLSLEWLASRVHILVSVVGFAMTVGMRVWLSLLCPQFGTSGLLIIVTAVMFMLSLMNDAMGNNMNFITLFKDYLLALIKKARSGSIWYSMTLMLTVYSVIYIGWAYRHVYQYFTA